MSNHAPTLERLHSFEELGKRATDAYIALWLFACGVWATLSGDFAAATGLFLFAGLNAEMFDRKLDAAHCEYTTLAE